MKQILKHNLKKGDISILVTILISSIILILLTPISQKLSIESQISKENLMSQQAVQAAKTGLDAWMYEVSRIGTFISDPIQTIINNSNPRIEYKVKFEDGVNKLISTGIVTQGNLTIERTLEQTFE
jgi:hypothetical protein